MIARSWGVTIQPGRGPSGPLHPGFGGEVDRALAADVVEMPVEELSRRALSGAVQELEEIEVGLHFAAAVQAVAERAEIDAMDVEPAILVVAGAVGQGSVVDQLIDES